MNSRIAHFLRQEWLQLLVIGLPLAVAFIVQPYAVKPVPIRWDFTGQAVAFVPQNWGLFLTPALTALAVLLIMVFESRDPNRLNEDGTPTSHGRAVRTIRLALSIIFAALCLIQFAWAMGHYPDSTKFIPFGTALLFAFTGNFFGKLKPNRYVGIRVPWTLNSETVWRQTHRFAGWLWTVSGVMMSIAIWFVPPHLLSTLGLIWLALIVVLPLLFAWRLARTQNGNTAISG